MDPCFLYRPSLSTFQRVFSLKHDSRLLELDIEFWWNPNYKKYLDVVFRLSQIGEFSNVMACLKVHGWMSELLFPPKTLMGNTVAAKT